MNCFQIQTSRNLGIRFQASSQDLHQGCNHRWGKLYYTLTWRSVAAVKSQNSKGLLTRNLDWGLGAEHATGTKQCAPDPKNRLLPAFCHTLLFLSSLWHSVLTLIPLEFTTHSIPWFPVAKAGSPHYFPMTIFSFKENRMCPQALHIMLSEPLRI